MKSTKQLPARAELGQLRRQAKDLLSGFRAGTADAKLRVKAHHPRYRRSDLHSASSADENLRLTDAQLVLAREYGFSTWLDLRRRVEAIDLDDPVTAFTEAACVPLDGSGHGDGDLKRCEAIRHQFPNLIGHDVYTAAILGDDVELNRLLEHHPDGASEPGGLYDWDPLTYLCFSKYLKRDKERSTAFVRAARVLLDHGANANTGFFWQDHDPGPALEAAIYGAAAVAQHAELTRLLLDHGADPNDGETAYHVAEGWDNATLKVIVESGKLNQDGLTTLLTRKLDWHDYDAIKWLLQHGADPNRISFWGRAALQHAISRSNHVAFFELLLDHGADPLRLSDEAASGYFKAFCAGKAPEPPSRSAVALAARAGRGDVLELFQKRGVSMELSGIERLLSACATNDVAQVRSIVQGEPHTVRELVQQGAPLLAAFAGFGNTPGVGHLLDLGIDVGATRGFESLPYYVREGKPPREWRMDRPPCLHDTALHVAAWNCHHDTVKLLIEHSAPIDLPDGNGQTPLALAVRACVESYWTHRRSPDSVRALLDAGAHVGSVDRFPSGYDEVDQLLQAHGAEQPDGTRGDAKSIPE